MRYTPSLMPLSTQIVGHREQLSDLLQDLSSGNVSHAYLFAGSPHLGKFTIAKWFAKRLLVAMDNGPFDPTQDRQWTMDKEIVTKMEEQVDKLIHPDLFVIDQLWIEDMCEDFDVIAKSSNIPQQHRSKAGAKSDSISIDDIRALQDRLFEVSTGKHRCCLIRRAERMHTEAVNALLKILEEPPPGVVFLLTTESFSSLMGTLVSRTRVIRFSRCADKDMRSLLGGCPEDEAGFLLRLAQGAPGKIIRLRDDPAHVRQERTVFANAVAFWQSHSLMERLRILAPLQERTEEADHFLLHLALALRDSPDPSLSRASALHALVRALATNAQRQLLAQRFALSI